MNNYKKTLLHDLLARVAKLEEEQRDLFNCHHFVIKAITERLEKLEAQANHFGGINKMVPPPVATNKELHAIWRGPCSLRESLRAIYNLGIEHGQARSREVAEPAPVAGELVERVAMAIHPDRCADPNLYLHEARAAILEVAASALRMHPDKNLTWERVSLWLEQEAGR